MAIDKKNKIIFVVGNSRSGTTLMGSIIGRSRSVFTFEELHFFNQLCPDGPDNLLDKHHALNLVAKLLSIQASDILTPLDSMLFIEESKGILEGFNEGYITASEIFQKFISFKSSEQDSLIACEQTPQNVFYIEQLLSAYPNCQIINMIRDPRDILLSQKYKWKIRFLGASNIPFHESFRAWANYHPVVTTKLWNSAIKAASAFRDHPRVTTVKFEDLIQSPELVIEKICSFIGISFEADMLNVSQSEGGVSSHKEILSSQRGIDQKSIGKWRKGKISDAEIFICQALASENMRKYGYSSVSVGLLGKIISVIFIAYLPFKLSLAMLLNLRRMNNIFSTIKRRI